MEVSRNEIRQCKKFSIPDPEMTRLFDFSQHFLRRWPIFKISELVVHAGSSIQFQSPSFSSVRSRMESRQVKTEKGLALYFQQLARHRTMSSCQVRPSSVPECFNTRGTGADWFLKYFTACGENRLWILKVFPTCAASEDTSW